jgi:hypothetical protein
MFDETMDEGAGDDAAPGSKKQKSAAVKKSSIKVFITYDDGFADDSTDYVVLKSKYYGIMGPSKSPDGGWVVLKRMAPESTIAQLPTLLTVDDGYSFGKKLIAKETGAAAAIYDTASESWRPGKVSFLLQDLVPPEGVIVTYDTKIQVRGDLQRMLQLSNSSTAESDNVASLIA